MKNKRLPILLIFALALLVLAGIFIRSGRDLSQSHEKMEAARTRLLLESEREINLVPEISHLVKNLAPQENSWLEEVKADHELAIRSQDGKDLSDQASMTAFAQTQARLQKDLALLSQITTKYPKLEADKNFRIISQQLISLGDRITQARAGYASAVQTFNQALSSVPGSICSGVIFHFKPAPELSSSS